MTVSLPPATPRLTRRRLLVGLTATAGAAILAACGGDTAPAAPTPATTPSTVAAPTAAASTTGTTGAMPTTAPAMMTRPAGTAAPAGMAAANNAPGMMQQVVVPTPPATIPKGGTYTRASVGTDAKSFHPFLTSDTVSGVYQGYVFGGASLIKYDPNTLDLVPDATTKFEVAPDRKTYTFTLRDNLKWSDGKPITTDDYVWTFEQVKKPENKYPYLDNLKEIVSYTAKDARTLVVTLTEPLVTGLSDADAVTPLPRHIWEKYDWTDAAKNPEINAPTVGSGALKLKEWKRDSQATFVANDLYWEGRPNIDTWVTRVFGNATLAYQALKNGEVDQSGFGASDYKEAKGLANIAVPEWYSANGSWSYIGFNLRRPGIKDPLVRKAISTATDRNGLIDGVLFGLGRPLYSAFPQSSWAYNPNVEHYDFDVKKAADLFKQAGYTLQGNRLVKDGQQMTLKLLYATGSKTTENIATVVQQQLGDLGIKVDAQALEFQALLEATKKEPFDWDMFLGGWSATTEPYYSYQIWAESSIPELNRGNYVNKDVDKLFEASAREFDREKRKAIFGDIQKRITDDVPYVFLFENRSYVGINKRVGGVSVGPFGTYDLHKWYLTK